MAKYVNWYVDIGKWSPNREEWLKLISCIAEVEVERLNRFVFKDDAKSALIGRALIRKFASQTLEKPSNEIRLTRNQQGRPEICKSQFQPRMFDFNVSHSGDYCVLAGVYAKENECKHMVSVGVDVTKIVKKKTKEDLNRFLELMSRREFLPSEWETVSSVSDDRQKCYNFTRLWCLKESFIKSIGLGLKFKLNRICFEFNDINRYNMLKGTFRNGFITDTRVILDNRIAQDWAFLETALDDQHLVAIGYNFKNLSDSIEDCSTYIEETPFTEMSIETLTRDLTPISEVSDSMWTKFQSKSTKNR